MTNSTYATDLTDDQWQLIKELRPAAKTGGRPRSVCLRAVMKVLLYVLVGGGAWQLLPLYDLHGRTVYGYLRAWQEDGTWQRVHDELHTQVRREAGCHKVEDETEQNFSKRYTIQQLLISQNSFYKWRQQYGRVGIPEAKRLKELESENQKLKKLVAQLSLDDLALEEVNAKKW